MPSSKPPAEPKRPRTRTDSESASGRYTDGRPTRGQIGTLSHQVITDLAHEGARQPTPKQVLCAVGAHQAVRANTGRSGGVRQQVVCDVSIYFRLFGPAPDWRLTLPTVRWKNAIPDLVWEHADGQVLIDEIKTGRLDRLALRDTIEQARRLLAAGSREFGEQLLAVRVCSLAAPSESFFLLPDGNTPNVEWPTGA